jgi:hypothetical protein
MLPQEHFIYGLFFAGFLFLVLPYVKLVGFLLIVLSTVLLDSDHFIYYIAKKKDFNLINAYRFFRNNTKKFKALPLNKRAEYFGSWSFFHGIEWVVLFFLLTFFISKYFGFLFIGVSFHLLLDYTGQWRFYRRKDKFSIIYDFFKFRKLKDINSLQI